MNFDEIYTKKVIALDDAGEVGAIVGLYLNSVTFDCAGIAVEYDQNYLLESASVVGKETFVTINNKACLLSPSSTLLKIMPTQKVITRSGKELGCITSLVWGRKNVKIMLGEEESIAPYKIVAASQNYVLVNPKASKPSASVEAEVEITVSEPINKEALTIDNTPSHHITQLDNASNMPAAGSLYEELFVERPPAPSHFQTRGTSPDYSFLLGRKVEREITDLGRTFYIAVGTIVTDQILSNAKKAGKIADLAINSSKTQG